MGKIAAGYGSEWHLLRFLGRHREFLDSKVIEETGGLKIDWLDFAFSDRSALYDRELTGLEFIDALPVLDKWKAFWPSTGSAQNWDAVGVLHTDGDREWLLVEAKAHLGEIVSSCGASPRGGLKKIQDALEETKAALGVSANADWLNGYYQYANRLACLHFLSSNGIRARLVMIYFVGDQRKSDDCPTSNAGWMQALSSQDSNLGLVAGHYLEDRVHKVFLNVAGP